jgi:superfamily II RNA helicase
MYILIKQFKEKYIIILLIMVQICSMTSYTTANENKYKTYFDYYNYPLHIFQKWAIQAIVEKQHVLVCAPTGSGKTLPGEFAINFFHSKKKKTIYTTPIKALSNEKFYNFTLKYPHISIGLITGDIKTNPDADVLIMTTEILLNKIYQINSKSTISSSISFEMNIEEELGCVIFDEIHMINDESRGHIWEQCIMMLPSHIQIIGLSATLNNPEKFAYWLEMRGEQINHSNKQVYLTRQINRAVPLIHYSFITTTNGINKLIKDKSIQDEIKKSINKPFVIQDAKNIFNETQYQHTTKILNLLNKHNAYVKRHHILNKLAEYLVNQNMLPALCYVFSRKQLEKCAEELTTNLLEFDSKTPYIIDRECEQIIRKLPNFEEYLNLPEYLNIVKLLRKGVGIHHAGLMPILREMIELLFAKGFIKILFCTETMSVGINLPVKTTIFTDINKFNGEIIRSLYSHEYTQAAGRAGRLGIDVVGHVIHLNNLFKNVQLNNYKLMMNGSPQLLMSKFKISYNFILNMLSINNTNLIHFCNKSMITNELDSQMKELYYKISNLNLEMDKIKDYVSKLKTPIDVIKEYINLNNNKFINVNKKRKEIDKKIQQLDDNYKFIQQDKNSFLLILSKEEELQKLQTELETIENFVKNKVISVLQLLNEELFIEGDLKNESSIKLTMKGNIASQIRETHCLIFTHFLENKRIDTLTSKQFVSIFSCFTNIKVKEDLKDITPNSSDAIIQENILYITQLYSDYKKKELNYNINTGFDYTIQYDLINYVLEWCDCNDIESCKLLLQKINTEKEIFLGEFVKALLKINNISSEFEKIAELTGNIYLLSKLKEIPNITLKYVVTNQSLYV